jgi:hypothetical protein
MRIRRSQLKSILVEELSPWQAEQTDGGLGEQVAFGDYTSENFDLCPGAVKAFINLKDKMGEQHHVDLAIRTMRAVDEMLGIERDVLAADAATEEQFESMVDLAGQSRITAGQLGAEIGHDLTSDFKFIGGHLIKVAKLLRSSDEN